MDEYQTLVLGEQLTVRTVPGREGKPIARLPDGRVVLFDRNNEFFEMLDSSQSVEGRVIVISESYVILAPSKAPEPLEEVGLVYYKEIDMDDIVEDLEKLVEKVSGNAEVIPRALLRILQLNQLIIGILKRGVQWD